ncbi:hypothetical protein J2Y48_003788 [Mycoplana sp. BE70]|uniref:hypothetical protein n=1 Tax=Mycoplana sp. BE70 TaxID=2817775 RepID=UPI00285E50FD|nr:hypothetical protein [Mycoplana sp. BE70]MDR6758488.1 hypothetical protein [Mycoplana sp. BE70]
MKMKKPIIYAPSPFPGERALQQGVYPWLKHPDATAAMLWIADICRKVWREMAEDVGAALILQPLDTISTEGLTLARYQKGVTRSTGSAYSDTDTTHMNKDLGRRFLDEIGATLRDRNHAASSAASRPSKPAATHTTSWS